MVVPLRVRLLSRPRDWEIAQLHAAAWPLAEARLLARADMLFEIHETETLVHACRPVCAVLSMAFVLRFGEHIFATGFASDRARDRAKWIFRQYLSSGRG
jgi:hypothetical protein